MVSEARRRRTERARGNRWKNLLVQNGKYLLIGVLLVAALGAAATFYRPPPGKEAVHDHAVFALFIEEQRVSFRHPDYDAARTGMGIVHMHSGDPADVMHIEGRFPGGVFSRPLRDVFSLYGLTISPGYLKLDTKGGHNGTEWRDQGNHTWQAYVSRVEADQRLPFEPLADPSQFVARNLDKILLTYGDLTPDQVARQQAAIGPVPGDTTDGAG